MRNTGLDEAQAGIKITGRDWGQEEKAAIEGEMAGWHYGLDGRESE